MFGINTSVEAMNAARTLALTDRELRTTQKAISTGKAIASATDNGAVWTIANKMAGDVTSYERVRESNERAGAVLDTAIAAAESIMALLTEMRAKALAATQPALSGPSQSALNADFAQLRDQITSVIANASFDGTNMIGAGPAAAISLGDTIGSNGISIAGANLSLGGTIITVAAGSDLASTANATATLSLVNTSMANLGTQLATWGAGATRLELHRDFVRKLQDALSVGIGAMTDADVSKESAKLQSLQVKQQLGIQVLSIANNSGQAALSLFRN